MSLSGVDRPVQYETQADTMQSTNFDAPSEAAIAMLANSVSANVCSQGGSIGTDSNLAEPWSVFQDGDLSGKQFVSMADTSSWGEMEQELLAFQPDSGTRPTDGKVLTASPMNGSPPNWPDLLAHETSHLRSESNYCSDITFSGCGLGCQLLDFAHTQLAGMNTFNEYDSNNYPKYIYSNTNGGCSNPTLNFQLNEAAHSLLGNHYSEKQSGLADNLCVRPEVLVLSSSYHSPLAQPRHPENQSTDEDDELLTSIDIIGSPSSNLPPSHPIPAFDDLIFTFNLNPRPPQTKRKRSSFTRAGKEKLRLVRDSGACVLCRLRKVSCSAKEVCDQCRRTVDDPIIAKQICLRTRIQDIYIGVKELQSSLIARNEQLQNLLTSLDGKPQDIRLSLASETEGHRSIALCVQVMRCAVSPKCRWKSLKKTHGIYITSNKLEEKRYVIMPNSLPGVEDLDAFGRGILLMSPGSLSGKMTRLLDDFLSCYSSQGGFSTVRHLSNLTLRIASLSNFVAYGFLNLQDGSYDLLERLSVEENHPEKFVSETVHDQIRVLAAEGLEPAEKHVFSELDNLSKIVGVSNHARIIAGTCLLRLLVLYRDRLLRDQIRLELPRTKPLHQLRIEQSAFMYRRLTVAYGTLCREHDSPLTMNWEDEGMGIHMNENEELKTIFSQLRCAFRQFCRENLTCTYDDVFKSLISEPIKGRKTRKRRRTTA